MFHERVKTHPQEFPKTIKQLVEIQKKMLKKFDFLEEKGKKCVDWIEKFCILTEGEKSGQKVKLLLWQKWFIYSIFCFYGYFDEEQFDENGESVGIKQTYSRVVKDVLLIVASGNAKTSLYAFINAYILYQNEFVAPNIFIGSNSHQQSRICFDATMKCIQNNRFLNQFARIIDSRSIIQVEKNHSKLIAMSSDGGNQEGIIPSVIVLDEIHVMKNGSYAKNLRKSTKRSDLLILEGSTHGMVRGGYLDERIDLARRILEQDVEVQDYRKLFVLFEQDNEEEVFEAYKNNDFSIYKKSNPSLGFAVNTTMLKEKVAEMLNDPRTKAVNLTKNFNIPQNAENCFFSKNECITKPFNEEIFNNAPVFVGLDMAWTRSPQSDLAVIRIMMVNPFTEERFNKDFYFLPKYYDEGDGIKQDMIKLKSKEDSNIPFDRKNKIYGYELYKNHGDVVILDEELQEEFVNLYGEQARFDLTGVTENFIIYFIAYIELKYNFRICKFGLDPNKATQIESFFNSNIQSLDGKDVCVKFMMERTNISNPIIERVKDLRSRGLVYNNNKLTELHFASTRTKESSNGFHLVNSKRERKDGVIGECACESAYNVFTTNKFTGEANLQMLKEWWIENEERIKSQISL